MSDTPRRGILKTLTHALEATQQTRGIGSVPPLLTPEGRRFRRRIDSLSFEEGTTDKTPRSTQQPSSPSSPLTPEVENITSQESLSGQTSPPTPLEDRDNTEASVPSNQAAETSKNSSSNSFHQLRSGNKYRRRIISLPDLGIHLGECEEPTSPPPLTIGSKETRNNITNKRNNITKEMAPVNFDKVSQLVHLHIPLFSGENGPNLQTEVRVFLKCCEQVKECLTDEEEVKFFLRLLATRFRGKAFLVLSGASYNSLPELKKTLEEKFMGKKPYGLLVDELRQMRQLPGESLGSFCSRLSCTYKSCQESAIERHPTHAEAVVADLEESAILAFKSGILDPNFQFYFLQDEETKLDALLRKAERMEEMQKQLFFQGYNRLHKFTAATDTPSDSYPIPQSATLNDSQNAPYTTFVNKPQNTTFKIKQEYFPTESQAQQQPQFPTSCHQGNQQANYNHTSPGRGNSYTNRASVANTSQGHHSKSFSDPTMDRFRPMGQGASAPKTGIRKQCQFCGRLGHLLAECRTRKNTPFCVACQTYGHGSKDCPRKKRTEDIHCIERREVAGNSNRRANSSEEGRPRRRKCEFCQRFGHSAEECRARLKWEAQSQTTATTSQLAEN